LNARTTPLVSICIPTFNGSQWIEKALRSALAQSYEPVEILVVDDHSIDNTVDVVRSFKDERVRVITNEIRQGLAGNWNQCVRLARGGLIKFLFQDDAFYPQCVETMVQVFNKYPQLGLVHARRELVFESDAPTELARELLNEYSELHLKFERVGPIGNGRDLFVQHLERRLYQCCVAEPPSTLIPKAVFARLGLFNTRMHQACDIEMWLRIMFFYDIGFVDEKLLIFRVHGKSATAANRMTGKADYDRYWLLEGLLNHQEIRSAHPEISTWRDDLLRRYRKSFIRPTSGWRSLDGKNGLREAVRDAREIPQRMKFLKEAQAFQKSHVPLHPRL